MGYTLAQPVINTANSNDLAQWKAHMQEIHDCLIDAGFIQTDDTGQIESFDSITELPPDNVISGYYRIYEVDDQLADQGFRIVFRLDFGCGTEGMRSSYRTLRTPRIFVTIGKGSDGAGSIKSHDNITDISPNVSYGCPQSFSNSGSNTTNANSHSSKYVCYNKERGFYGVVFACNGRGAATGSYWTTSYNGNSLLLMIQRTLDSSGKPSPKGFTVYSHNLEAGTSGSTSVSYRWPGGDAGFLVLNSQKTRTYSLTYDSHSSLMSLNVNLKQGMQVVDSMSGIIQVSPCYIYSKDLTYNPNLVTYRSYDLTEGTQFKVETAPGVFTNFIALGPGTSMFPDSDGQSSSYAMLFE